MTIILYIFMLMIRCSQSNHILYLESVLAKPFQYIRLKLYHIVPSLKKVYGQCIYLVLFVISHIRLYSHPCATNIAMVKDWVMTSPKPDNVTVYIQANVFTSKQISFNPSKLTWMYRHSRTITVGPVTVGPDTVESQCLRAPLWARHSRIRHSRKSIHS